jgi:hypothetical protein
MTEIVSDELVQKALSYFALTDEKCAKAKALMSGLENQLKTVKAVGYMQSEGTVAERESQAYTSQAYKDHVQKLEDATYDFELMRNKRLTEELIIEVWRSVNANRRKGNM